MKNKFTPIALIVSAIVVTWLLTGAAGSGVPHFAGEMQFWRSWEATGDPCDRPSRTVSVTTTIGPGGHHNGLATVLVVKCCAALEFEDHAFAAIGMDQGV